MDTYWGCRIFCLRAPLVSLVYVFLFSRGVGHALLLHPRAPGGLRRQVVPGNNGRDDLQAVGAEDRAERREGACGKASGE